MIMKIVKMSLILAFLSICALLVGCTTATPDDGNDNNENTGENFEITVDDLTNGTIEADKSKAKAGETVTLTITPDEDYVLVAGSLKANDEEINGTSFKMPKEDVVITALFILDAPEMSVVETDLMVEAKHNNKTAVAYLSTTFGNNSLTVKAMVEDEKFVKKSEFGSGDGLTLYLSRINSTEGYVKNQTYRLESNLNGDFTLSVYDGSNFVSKTDNSLGYEVSYFINSESKGQGYLAEFEIPYASLGLSSSDVKNNLTILPVLYNCNLESKNASLSTVSGCDYEKQN